MQAALFNNRQRRLGRLGGGGGPPAIIYDTLDPDTVTNGVLSDDLLTYTADGNTTSSGARSKTAKDTGKFYVEVTLSNLHSGGQTGIGFSDEVGTYANAGSNIATHGISEYLNSGDVYSGGNQKGNANGGLRTPASGDTIAISLDVDGKTASYQNLTSGAAKQGPFAIAVPGPYQFIITTNASAPAGFTVNFGATDFVGEIPDDYEAWGE